MLANTRFAFGSYKRSIHLHESHMINAPFHVARCLLLEFSVVFPRSLAKVHAAKRRQRWRHLRRLTSVQFVMAACTSGEHIFHQIKMMRTTMGNREENMKLNQTHVKFLLLSHVPSGGFWIDGTLDLSMCDSLDFVCDCSQNCSGCVCMWCALL